ncbi:type 1 glutamine amidotransferase [Aristophania vespae]|uniref:Type 1 glutamine amidotransferase n=1 Tax=Aristophania vespae TaxID=2697033 RepID=A0A6P1NEJ6_9PROT|nr:DJ-1/PfpI family protein [Aristophania vespae]QHI95949.1 type 1 glutamine amidotransferase [Aristophania vespae]UMM63695.1 hypothetical protein DM15PD_06700 [Aristophania vespae]
MKNDNSRPEVILRHLASDGEPATPTLDTLQFLGAEENREIREGIFATPAIATLRGKKIAVIATDGVEDIELVAILTYFKRHGADTHLIAPKCPKTTAASGMIHPPLRKTHIFSIHYVSPGRWHKIDHFLDDVDPTDYDAVIIPGGTWSPDSLRADKLTLNFVKKAHKAKKIVAAICHGPWVLADAGLLKGRKATAWWSMKKDLENAGAIWEDKAVIDDEIITSRCPNDLLSFVFTIAVKLKS